MQPSPREEVTIEEALQKNVGEFGLGQRYVFVLASVPRLALNASVCCCCYGSRPCQSPADAVWCDGLAGVVMKQT